MIFDDLFYPDNPKRRQQVANLRGEITITFKNFTSSWNDNANMLNGIFSKVSNPTYAKMKIKLISKNIEKNTINECLEEIKTVLEDSKTKMEKLVSDLGLSELLPDDWKEKGIKVSSIGEAKIAKIGRIISGIASTAAAAFIGYYIFQGVTTAIIIISAVTSTALSIAGIVGGAFFGAVLGGAAFIITDLIASAITGAIERKELNNAIDSLIKLKESISPIKEATPKLAGITQSIKDGCYKLDDTHLLVKMADGSYRIIPISSNSKMLQDKIMFDKSHKGDSGILFLSA